MTSVLLVPDLPLERWPSMDRYASRLSFHLRRYATDLQIAVAGHIGALTVERPAAEPGTFASIPVPFPVLPTPGANEARRYLARYWRYPSRIRRRDADVLHVLDHSYAHVVDWWRKGPRVVTVHDLLPVLTVQRGSSTLRERIRNGLLERVLRALRTADAWIVATEWLRGELAGWLGHARNIHVIPIPGSDVAAELGHAKLLNMVMLGAMLERAPVLPLEAIDHALDAHMPAHRRDLLEANKQALRRGIELAKALTVAV